MIAVGRKPPNAKLVKFRGLHREREILLNVANLPAEILDGRHHPCPKQCAPDAGGKDRFRLIDEKTGAVYCNQCFNTGNGDYISAVQWARDVDFNGALDLIADYLGMTSANGEAAKPRPTTDEEFLSQVCSSKRMPIESAKAYGAKVAMRGRKRVIRLPMYGADGEQCSEFDIPSDGGKGWSAKGKPTGLFLPHDSNGVRILPQAGDSWTVHEGGKDPVAAHSLGYLAAGLPTSTLNERFGQLFSGVNVIFVPDLDDASFKGADQARKRLAGSAASFKLARLPGEMGSSDDLRDVLAKPGGELLVGQATAAAVEPPPLAPSIDDCISNGIEVEVDTPDGTITKVEPLKMPDIIELVERVTGGALNRLVGGDLFVKDSHGLCWFARPDSLFGWLAQFKQVKWYAKPGFVSKGEFFHELQRTATAFNSIEALPHEPKLPDHFYSCSEFESGDGAALNQLVAFFRPETTVDRELIKAMFVTPCWGGRPGSRPAWAITSDGGRGVGKTKLAESLAYLWGGFIDVSANEEIETLKSRLLSSGAMSRRVALLDNVKAGVFSSATLEALITTPTISGKRLYHGEAVRPNTINWLVTVNGLSLSTDLAQRCVILKLLRGENRSTWFEDVIAFIDANLPALLADCISFLRSPPVVDLPRYSRWAAWEGAVLSRLENPIEAQRLILERQAACDADSDEMGLVEDFFADQLLKLGYAPDTASVRIPVAVVARWFNWATGDRTRTAGVTRRLKQASDEGQLQRLSVDTSRTYGRNFIWEGPHCDVNERTQNDLDSRIRQAAQNKDGRDAW